MDEITTNVRYAQWAEIIAAANTSGMSKRQFCLQNGLKPKSFYYYQRKIRQKAYGMLQDSEEPQIVEVPVQHDMSHTSGAVAVIRVADVSVEVSEGISEETLMSIGRMIRNAL